ncbi:MAG TPA: hypothetical protein VKV39_04430 [Candidatus Sulfotelmatobacter sp.]|nr:hypothetical protein [Candidatus Sulfotelmatobacter sp.]
MLRRAWFLVCLMLVAMQSLSAAAPLKPYRVLIVISDQWKDPRSFLVSGSGEFQTIVTLFKSWGIPFDILRLDQTLMDPNHFTDFEGKPRYGAILWDVPGDASQADQALVTDAVEKLHISLIAIGDRLRQPAIQRLLGVQYKSEHMNSAHAMVKGDSFILRGLAQDLRQQGPEAVAMRRVQVEATDAKVLAEAGGVPQVTEREVDHDTRAIWIGGDIDQMLLYQPMRTTLRRAVTEAIGYSLTKSWTKTIVLTMDDMGNAQNAWLEHWHYPALSAEQIRHSMIEPLQAHHAILSLNIVPGFVDDAQHKIVPTWHQQFTDEFGVKQDYVSTKKGLDEGIAAGVLEIESHGWTHMQPDLDSPPGPWWGSPLMEERAEVGWYREFYDIRRNREIAAAEQKFHMLQSADWIEKEFGHFPLEFSTGGNGVSRSPDNNTWRLAAEAGYGYYGGYLGRDLAVEGRADSNADFGGTDDVPLLLPAPPDGHDRGIAHDPEGFAKVFDKYPGYAFTGLDEYIGYQHAQIGLTADNGGAKLTVSYDPHYCRALIAKNSNWDFNVADWLRPQLQSAQIWVDGKSLGPAKNETETIPLAAGTEKHIIEIREKK